jgi:hypothetical protein
MVEKRPITKQTTNGSTTAEVTSGSPLPDRLAALENRVAAALSGDHSASELGNLLTQLDRAIPIAVEYARLESEKSLDPTASPDPTQARQQSEDAAFRANRLSTLRPRLASAYAAKIEQEAATAYLEKYDALLPERAQLEKEFATEYQQLSAKLVALFERVKNFQQRVHAALGNPPANVPVLKGIDGVQLIYKITLLDLDTGKTIWPLPQTPLGVTLAQSLRFSFDPRFSSEWENPQLREQRAAEAQAENEREAERFRRMTVEQEERQNRELKEIFVAAYGLGVK